MPEGHLLHFHARRFAERFGGRVVEATSPQGRFAGGAAAVDGRVLDEAEAYGKHLFLRFEEDVVHVHLGQQGTVVWLDHPPPEPRTSVRLRLAAPDAGAADLIAPLVCDLGRRSLRDDVVETLGPDPLRDDVDVERVRSALAATRRAIGDVLLDQAVVSGVGNVLRTEALFLAGLDPSTPASEVAFEPLWTILVPMMQRAAERGRIITTTDDDVPEPEARFVYKQDRCRRCDAAVERPVVGGRTMYVCPREQVSRTAGPATVSPGT